MQSQYITKNTGSSYNVFSCLGFVRADFTTPVREWRMAFSDTTRHDDGVSIALTAKLQAWVDGLQACAGMPDQLMYFAPWLTCVAVRHMGKMTDSYLVGKQVALNLNQAQAIHVSHIEPHELNTSQSYTGHFDKVHVVVHTHTRDQIVLRAAPGMTTTEIFERIRACSAYVFLGPFVHDSFQTSKLVKRSTADIHPEKQASSRWSVMIQQSAITSMLFHDQDEVQHGVPAPPGMPHHFSTPTVWRAEFWLNNTRHLSNVIVPSCAADRASMQRELLF